MEPFTPGETSSLAERAYRRLRDAIVEGVLPGGSSVSERSLGARLGISAQPVREALQRLEAEGMVITAPRRGTVVATFDGRSLAEMCWVRAALEATAAALAARNAADGDVAALRAQLTAMRAATVAGNVVAVSDANQRFHDRLHAMACNAFLSRSLQTLRAYERYARVRALLSSPREPAQALREHAAILAAVRRRDPVLAESRMRAHVRRSLLAGGVAELFTPHEERST